jgi:hypothetical protein
MLPQLRHPLEFSDRQAAGLHLQHLGRDLEHIVEIAALQRDTRILNQLLMSGVK